MPRLVAESCLAKPAVGLAGCRGPLRLSGNSPGRNRVETNGLLGAPYDGAGLLSKNLPGIGGK